MPVYLDANGNPLASSGQKTYLDSNGEPIHAEEAAKPGLIDRIQKSFDENTATHPGDSLLHRFINKTVQGAGTPFVHPVDTAVGAVKTIADTANPLRVGPPQFLKDAYHSVADSPDKAGAVAELLGNLVGGTATGELGGAALGAGIKAAAPLAGRAALLGKTPEGAYESALKPSPSVDAGTRAQVVDIALKNSIPVSKGGLAKLQDQIETLNQAIKQEIDNDPTRPIDPNKVATRADDAHAKFSQQVNKTKDLNAIEESRQQFLQEQGQPQLAPGVAGPAAPAPPMNAADAQAMKQGTYRVLKGKFGEQGSASVEAQKALARGLKEEIATAFPEIAKMNASESRLLELQPLLERAVNRISNHQAVGIGTPAAGAAMKAASGSGVASSAAMVMKAVLDNPGIKSRLAIAVSKGAKIPYADALARVAAYSGSLGAIGASPQESTDAGNPNPPTDVQP